MTAAHATLPDLDALDPNELKVAAAIYSLIGTAKLNGIDSESYLRSVLSRIADHPINRIEELLPWKLWQNPPTLQSIHRSSATVNL